MKKVNFCADISAWQKGFDFKKYAETFESIVIKGGQGSEQDYLNFQIFYEKATENNLKAIAYWFADCSAPIEYQAVEFLNRLMKVGYKSKVVVIDYEWTNSVNKRSNSPTEIAHFIDFFHRNGYKVVLYSGRYFLQGKKVTPEELGADYFWVSNYGKNIDYTMEMTEGVNFEDLKETAKIGKCDMWQFTCKMKYIHTANLDFNYIFNPEIFDYEHN